MASIEIEVNMVCGVCGEPLSEASPGALRAKGFRMAKGPAVVLMPCSTCLDKAKMEGYDCGAEEAVKEVQDMVRTVRETPT